MATTLNSSRQIPHPLRNVWRALCACGSSTSQFILVEGHSRSAAKSKVEQACELAFDNRGDNPYYIESLVDFATCVRDGIGDTSSQRLFEAGHRDGANGRVPYFIHSVGFLASSQTTTILADAWRAVANPQMTQWRRLTRNQASQHLTNYGEKRLSVPATGEGDYKITEALRATNVGYIHCTEDLLHKIFGKPDKSLGQNRGFHWGIAFGDDIVVHVHQLFEPNERAKYDTSWNVCSYQVGDNEFNDPRGRGRLECLLSDLART